MTGVQTCALPICPAAFRQAIEALSELGYNPVSRMTWLQRSASRIGRKKDVYLSNADEDVRIELHWKLSGSHFSMPGQMDKVWDRLENRDLAGVPIRSLCFEDLLIYLCLHGSRHSWERLSWIADVHELILSEGDVEWEKLWHAAHLVGCENVVALGLVLVWRIFGYEPELVAWSRIKADPVYSEIADEIIERLFSATMEPMKIGERYLYHLKLRERWRDRLKLHVHYISWYTRLIFRPKQIDRDAMQLPAFLSPLYYVTRPVRLAYNYFHRSENS